MNYQAETPEKQTVHVSNLLCLFESKGYECEEIRNQKETLYIFKIDKPYRDYVKEPNPNWLVIS